MTDRQIRTIIKYHNGLDNFLKELQNQPHIKNKDVVKEVRCNIVDEIDRLIAWEKEEK